MKKAIINVQSTDNACFTWSIVAVLHPAERHMERELSYPYYSTVLNLEGIEFPVTLKQIKKFEQLNNILINVYGIEEQKILPIRLTDVKKERHIHMLYVQHDNADAGHFALIKNLSRLLSIQLNKTKNRKYFCDRCLQYFSSSDRMEKHSVECMNINECAIKLLTDNEKWLTFGNYRRKERVPFIVYADLKCTLEKVNDDSTTSTHAYQHHKAFSIGYYVCCSYDETLSWYRFRRDNNCIARFTEELRVLAHDVKTL
ncbi:uncharacterized protein [Cardiocondyla obscurior]|uniref:uncharacterized protein isoform X2 n=1 Tax=Cardiocondyla obscurior TaxID=286306 RepID=UPI003965617A